MRLLALFVVVVCAIASLSPPTVAAAGEAVEVGVDFVGYPSSDGSFQYGSIFGIQSVITKNGVPSNAGSVDFYVNETMVGTSGVSFGMASTQLKPETLGVHILKAVYREGADPASAVVSPTKSVAITKMGTDIDITIDPPSSLRESRSAVTHIFVAMRYASGVPTLRNQGIIDFHGQSSPSGQIAVTIDGHTRHFPVQHTSLAEVLKGGAHDLTVTYAGDTKFEGFSVTRTFTTDKMRTAFPGDYGCPPLVDRPARPLSECLPNIPEGGAIPVVASPIYDFRAPRDGTPMPAGEVRFASNNRTLAVAPLVDGVAKANISGLPAGHQCVEVSWSGDDIYAAPHPQNYCYWVVAKPISLGNHAASPAASRSTESANNAAYRVIAGNGAARGFGGASAVDVPIDRLAFDIVGSAATPSGAGYWEVASDGGVFSFGDASFHGSTGAMKLNKPIVALSTTSTGKGYWLVASDGGVFAFGDATFHGSTGAMKLNKPIVGMSATPTGNGYWLVASDGGIFAFGDASFRGSTGAMTLNKPIVGMASAPNGSGYWLVASDGGVFSFGESKFFGSTGAVSLSKPIVGIAATTTGDGYRFVASDGGIFCFGDASFGGSGVGAFGSSPVVAITR